MLPGMNRIETAVARWEVVSGRCYNSTGTVPDREQEAGVGGREAFLARIESADSHAEDLIEPSGRSGLFGTGWNILGSDSHVF